MTELYIVIGILLGLAIGYKGRKERDKRIAELEKELEEHGDN